MYDQEDIGNVEDGVITLDSFQLANLHKSRHNFINMLLISINITWNPTK